jgi:CheY-like chemotaxis protein
VTKRRGVIVEVSPTPLNLLATIHPSTLRHVLITAIEQMAQRMSGGTIQLATHTQGDAIQITVSGTPLDASTPLQSELMHEIVATHGGRVEVQSVGDAMRFAITLPSSGEKIVVMVIDDNADLVAFYRRYVAGTPYEIVHLADGNHVFAAIEETMPNIIVLDVLLPDLDGWELLTYLHEHPATRTIPILVASVVRGEELALALGAAAYMPKPVRRQQFIQALDQVRARDRA